MQNNLIINNNQELKELYGQNKYNPIEEKIFLKPLSKKIAKKLINKKISPNTISLLGFILTLLASLILILKINLKYFITPFILYLAILCDKIDGDLARLKNIANRKGQYIDSFFDFIGDTILTISLAYSINFNNTIILGLAILGPNLFNYHSILAPFLLDIIPSTHLENNKEKIKIKEFFFYGRSKHFLFIIFCFIIGLYHLPLYIFPFLIIYTFIIFLKNIFIKKLTKR